MPRYALLLCAGLITGALAQGGGMGANVRLVPHTDSNIRYSSVANGLGHAECTRVPSPCVGKWWSENNEGGTASLVRTRHATTGPGSSLSFTFSGSRQLRLGGKRDSSVLASVLLNGAQYPLSSDTDFMIFSTENLNPSTTYNVVLNYGGHGTLGFAGFAVDRNARVSQGQAPPSQPPGPTQLPGPTLQPAPSSPDEPTRTPPAQDPKPSDTTVKSGGGGSSTSPAPDPSSSDPGEGAQQPTNSPGAHDGGSPTNTRAGPAPSETPDNGNSNAVTPPTDGDDDDGTDDGSAGDQPGNAGAGSPQEGKNRMNTGAVAGGVIGGLLALILLGALAVWYARRRVRARRAPSYAFRHGPGEFAPAPHWTQRPASPQPEMAEKPLP